MRSDWIAILRPEKSINLNYKGWSTKEFYWIRLKNRMALCTYVKTPSKIKAFLNAEDANNESSNKCQSYAFRYGFGNITWRAFYETRDVNVYVQDLCGVPSIGWFEVDILITWWDYLFVNAVVALKGSSKDMKLFSW